MCLCLLYINVVYLHIDRFKTWDGYSCVIAGVQHGVMEYCISYESALVLYKTLHLFYDITFFFSLGKMRNDSDANFQ